MEFVGHDVIAIPLANVEIALAIRTNIVAVVKDRLVLQHNLESSFFIAWLLTPRVRNDAVLIIQDGDKTTALPHAVVVGLCAKTDA
jgi:hypothetical protein